MNYPTLKQIIFTRKLIRKYREELKLKKGF